MLTWFLIYLTSNCAFSAGLLGWDWLRDKDKTNKVLNDFYKDMPMNTTFTTLYLIVMMALVAIPTFLIKSVRGK